MGSFHLMEMNSCCGIDLRRLTLAITSFYLSASIVFLVRLTTYFIHVVNDDGAVEATSTLWYSGLVILDVVCLLIPSALGLFGAFRMRPTHLRALLIVHMFFIGFLFLALIACIVKTIWMLISAWIVAESVGEDFTAMVILTLIVALALPFFYFITSILHSYYAQRR